MKLNYYILSAVVALGFNALVLSSCSSSEDETDLEAKEPVEASEADAKEPVAHDAVPAPSAEAPMPSAPVEEGRAIPQQGAGKPAASFVSGRRVLYVKANGTKVHEKAEMNSKVVGRLDKGDHILVDIDGEWARTGAGHFVAMKSLSEKGIGRGKRHGIWRNPDGSTTKSAPAPKSAKISKAKAGKAAVTPAPTSAPSPVDDNPDSAEDTSEPTKTESDSSEEAP